MYCLGVYVRSGMKSYLYVHVRNMSGVHCLGVHVRSRGVMHFYMDI